MLTLFACPKPFRGHFAVIQKNAIWSWTLLRPRPEIILFGHEEGTARVASEFGVQHVPEVTCNEFGTPRLDGVFGEARRRASFDLLCYANADIILLDDFIAALDRIRRWRSEFLMVGRRTDLDIREQWDFTPPEWLGRLRALALSSGRQRPPEWIDYFAFSKRLAEGLLPLALGRPCFDNWFIWHARALGAPVVDASRVVLAVHQNHDYSHHRQGHSGVWQGEEAMRNRTLAGGWWRHYTTADATHILSSAGIERNLHHWVVKFERAAHYTTVPILFPLLDLTRPIRHRLGLRRKPQAAPETGRRVREDAPHLASSAFASGRKETSPRG